MDTNVTTATAPNPGLPKHWFSAAAGRGRGPPEFLGVSLAYELSQFCTSSSAGM